MNVMTLANRNRPMLFATAAVLLLIAAVVVFALNRNDSERVASNEAERSTEAAQDQPTPAMAEPTAAIDSPIETEPEPTLGIAATTTGTSPAADEEPGPTVPSPEGVPGMSEPAGRYPNAAGMSPDGQFEYWNAEHPTGETGCEGASQALWVHDTTEGTWLPAFIEGSDQGLDIIGNVVWSPFDETVAFTLACEGYGASVYRADRTGDGRLTAVEGQVIPGFERGAVRAIDWVSPSVVDLEFDPLDGSDWSTIRYDPSNSTFVDPLPWLIVNGLGELSFGASGVDDAQQLIDPIFGAGASSDVDCPTGSNQIVSWGGLDLIFRDEVLQGWRYSDAADAGPQLETPSGVRIGMAQSDMAAVYQGVSIQQVDLTDVSEFSFTVEAGTMSGRIENDRISNLNAGDACSFD